MSFASLSCFTAFFTTPGVRWVSASISATVEPPFASPATIFTAASSSPRSSENPGLTFIPRSSSTIQPVQASRTNDAVFVVFRINPPR